MKTTLADTISRVIEYHLNDVHTCLPGQIVSYDYETQSAEVKPLIKKTYYNGQIVPLPVIVNVPVGMPAGGGATINMPVKAGDKVLILFSERSIERWLANGDDVEQGIPRRFDLTDAFALPGFNPLNYKSKGNGKDFILDYKNSTITIKENGDIEIKCGNSILTLNNAGDISLHNNNGTITLNANGTFDISNLSDNLFSILIDTLTACEAITVQGHSIDNQSTFASLKARMENLI